MRSLLGHVLFVVVCLPSSISKATPGVQKFPDLVFVVSCNQAVSPPALSRRGAAALDLKPEEDFSLFVLFFSHLSFFGC